MEAAILFGLATLLFIWGVYNYLGYRSDKKEIIKRAMNQDNVKDFLERFCLNQKNEWCQKNPERLKHITADDLRKLRNSLTHFFSVAENIGVANQALDEKSRQLEKETNFKAKFISPEDLYEIIKGSALLMIKKWSEDCKNDLEKNSNEFKEKILSVKSVVDNYGVMIIKNKSINI